MSEKKVMIINCDVCDARKAKEEDLSGYEHILINTDLLLVTQESKGLLERLPVMCNTDNMVELEGDANVIVQNENYVIGGAAAVPENSVLAVNGDLEIRPDAARETLENFRAVTVNGDFLSPVSLAGCLQNLTVNGSMEAYPDDCTVLEAVFVPDRYFHLRAKEGRRYYVAKEVRLTDPEAGIAMLKEKNIRFVTPAFLVPEERAEESLDLFEETSRMEVIPRGMTFVGADAKLNEKLLKTHGKNLYIKGNLTLEEESAPLLSQVEKIRVRGTVRVPEKLEEAVLSSEIEYDSVEILEEEKGRILENRSSATLNTSMLDASPEGIVIQNCAVLKIKEDVEPQKILDLVKIRNCAQVHCTEEQKPAVELVGTNVAQIGTGEDGKDGMGFLGMMGNAAISKVINADKYIL